MIRLSGIQLCRGIQGAGGLWNSAEIARACGLSPETVRSWQRRGGEPVFPRPILAPAAAYGRTMPLFAGEDVLDWLEAREKWYSAQRLADAIHRIRLRPRQAGPV